MYEDLEKQYNALLHEYQKCVEKKMAFFYQCAIKRMKKEIEEKRQNTIKGITFLL